MFKSILTLVIGVAMILWLNVGHTCGEGAEPVKPLVTPSSYPRGYLFKHYTPCRGKWYPKGYKCKPREHRKNEN